MDLALHHPDRAGQLFRRRVGVLGLQHRHAPGDRHAELGEQRLGLIFVDIHCGRSRNPFAVNFAEFTPISGLAYHIPSRLQGPRISSAGLHYSNHRPSKSGAIFLQASTSPCTAPTDLSKASRSLPASSISTMRSTPLPPITTGTPTYMSFTLYSPLRYAAQGSTRFLSFR